jgi:hypothetical protein
MGELKQLPRSVGMRVVGGEGGNFKFQWKKISLCFVGFSKGAMRMFLILLCCHSFIHKYFGL